jgi:hypothetical protein
MQGPVYSKVIDAVCEQSQVDFEEGGIDQGTLDLLKSVRRFPSCRTPCSSCKFRLYISCILFRLLCFHVSEIE